MVIKVLEFELNNESEIDRLYRESEPVESNHGNPDKDYIIPAFPNVVYEAASCSKSDQAQLTPLLDFIFQL